MRSSEHVSILRHTYVSYQAFNYFENLSDLRGKNERWQWNVCLFSQRPSQIRGVTPKFVNKYQQLILLFLSATDEEC